MLPLYLLTSAKNQQILVELKNGETINGTLINCDSWMNLTLSDVIQSFNNGESFHKIKEIYVKGIHIKYLRMPDSIMDRAKEQNAMHQEQRGKFQKRRGGGYGNGGGYGGGNRRNNRNSGGYNNYNNQNNNHNNNNQNNNNQNNNNQNNNNNNRRWNNHNQQFNNNHNNNSNGNLHGNNFQNNAINSVGTELI